MNHRTSKITKIVQSIENSPLKNACNVSVIRIASEDCAANQVGTVVMKTTSCIFLVAIAGRIRTSEYLEYLSNKWRNENQLRSR
jgi:hypothetical protein